MRADFEFDDLGQTIECKTCKRIFTKKEVFNYNFYNNEDLRNDLEAYEYSTKGAYILKPICYMCECEMGASFQFVIKYKEICGLKFAAEVWGV